MLPDPCDTGPGSISSPTSRVLAPAAAVEAAAAAADRRRLPESPSRRDRFASPEGEEAAAAVAEGEEVAAQPLELSRSCT